VSDRLAKHVENVRSGIPLGPIYNFVFFFGRDLVFQLLEMLFDPHSARFVVG
jgi:hypothetical protein